MKVLYYDCKEVKIIYAKSCIKNNTFSCARNKRHFSINSILYDKKKTDRNKYQNTINLLSTKFPNRSNKDLTEELIRKCSQDVYTFQKTKNSPVDFVLHDGPPYANGDVHLGHALNKILKDIICRYQILKGKKISYIPGWDCHGLPIELKALNTKKAKELEKKGKLNSEEIRKLAKEVALFNVNNQRNAFKSWAVIGEWDNPYITMDPDYEIRQLKIFKKMLSKSLVYRQFKPVYWSIASRTALAEAELEYTSHTSKSMYVSFPLVKSKNLKNFLLTYLNNENDKDFDINLLIWTTTPWTLVANKAIAINKNINYSLLKKNNRFFIIADSLANYIKENVLTGSEIIKSNIPGETLLTLKYKNNLFTESTSYPILHADYVSSESGTGLVHTAPSHGMEDYLLCLENNIQANSLVDSKGKYINDLPKGCENLAGMDIFTEGHDLISKMLSNSNSLIKTHLYTHQYPIDWRFKKLVIIRATSQWFFNVENIKTAALKSLDSVKFFPKQSEQRLRSFTKSRKEWCISRQRVWGVPIPMVYDVETDEPLLEEENVTFIISQIEKLGMDHWFTTGSDASDWVLPKFLQTGKKFTKKLETLDVWFDSGTSWTLIDEKFPNRNPLADVYLEGTDQHRGWFQSSLLTKIATSDESTPSAPFNNLITNGFTMDENGLKMSKSLGNIIAPDKIIKGDSNLKGIGIDGLRIFIAQSDYFSDIFIGKNVIENSGNILKKFRQTFRYLLGNISDFNEANKVKYDDLGLLDKIAFNQVLELEKNIELAFDQFSFNKGLNLLRFHVQSHLSAFYFDVSKDTLYSDEKNSIERRSIQTVFVKILEVYTKYLSPIVPLLTQEVWDHTPGFITKGLQSPFYKGNNDLNTHEILDIDILQDYEILEQMRSELNMLFETPKSDKIVSTLSETCLYINILNPENDSLNLLLSKYSKVLRKFFICSDVIFSSDSFNPKQELPWFYSRKAKTPIGEIELTIYPSSKHKCPRCWSYSSIADDQLCKRCDEIVNK